MTLDQYISDPPAGVNNQFIDVDHEFGPQCWDLVEDYAERVLGVPKEPWAITLGPSEDAYEAWTVFDPHMQKWFDKIPVGQQQRGDINVYGPKPGFPKGHICIELGNGQVFQQNASQAGTPAHQEARTTVYMLGSLRVKGEDMASTVGEVEFNDLFTAFFGPITAQNPVLDSDRKAWIGAETNGVIRQMEVDPRHIAYQNSKGDSGNATVLSPGQYKVN